MQHYWNTRPDRIPDCLVAWLGRMHLERFLEAHGFEREHVEVALVE